MKSQIKTKLRWLHKQRQNLRRRFTFLSMFKILQRLEPLPDFPNSQCSDSQFLELTLHGARTTYNDLNDLLLVPRVELTKIDDFLIIGEHDLEASEALVGLVFKRHGSDKSTVHNYHKVYSRIFQKMSTNAPHILEIGLGTNNSAVPSNMGRRGKPGASLRAWRELFPEGQIVGADIDSSILFEEQNITTYLLDQTSSESWKTFLEVIQNRKFNLIIDDGLHSPSANLKTLLFSLNLLDQNGFLVIEDIHPKSLPVWSIALSSLKQDQRYWFLKTNSALCLVIQS